MIFNYNKIKKNNSPYIIAEIGVNHECSIKKAKNLILLAKKGGAHAAKFQTYKAVTLAKLNSQAYWDTTKEKTKSQFELFSKFDRFNEKDYRILAKFCKKNKIDFLSTPFDLDSVKILNPLVPAFKISSSDITNFPLLDKIAKTKKPTLLSTGASTLEEIKNAVNILKKGSNKITVMHCILNYPTHDVDANLAMISSLKKEYPEYVIGYSDHTLPKNQMFNLTTAYILGAKVIEKHFTSNKKTKGNDHYHSMDKNDLKLLVNNLNRAKKIVGNFKKKTFLKSEFNSRKYARRSIVIKNNLKKGKIIKENDLITLRPSAGISANQWNKVIGKKTRKNLKANKSLSWKDLYI